jgi:hypothetical protein
MEFCMEIVYEYTYELCMKYAYMSVITEYFDRVNIWRMYDR